MGFVTIVAGNYLAYAETLMASVRAVHPAAKTFIVLIDSDRIPKSETTTYLTAEDLLGDPETCRRQSMRYSVVEFATSLKARALKRVLVDVRVAVFLDPDCMVYERLDDVVAPAWEGHIVLTPHRITPAPLDGLEPSEETIKRYGVFNLGFIALSDDAGTFLSWWDERLMDYSSIMPSRTLFTDQRWIDLAPGYFSCSICRHPGANVAPWNLDERRIISSGGVLHVNDSNHLLLFAHFSTLGSQLSQQLQTLSFDITSHRASLNPLNTGEFGRLATSWWASVERANESAAMSSNYGYGAFANGQKISSLDRWVFHRKLLKAIDQGCEYPGIPRRSLVPFASGLVNRILGLSTVEGLRMGFSLDSQRWQARKARRRAMATRQVL